MKTYSFSAFGLLLFFWLGYVMGAMTVSALVFIRR